MTKKKRTFRRGPESLTKQREKKKKQKEDVNNQKRRRDESFKLKRDLSRRLGSVVTRSSAGPRRKGAEKRVTAGSWGTKE